MPDLYPVYLNMAGREALVVGGGAVAARKVAGLVRSGARITVVAPCICTRLVELAAENAVTVCHRSYRSEDLQGKWLVIAATDDPALNTSVSEEAARAGVFCNVVDQPSLCSFQAPAVCRRGLLQIAVSTGGASPALARNIRVQLESAYGPEYGQLVEGLLELRRHYRQKYPDDGDRRRRLLESFIDSPAPALLLEDADPDAFLRELQRWKSL